MEEKIAKSLTEIEAEHHVKVIYACEAGSRAWGVASAESDYDVRFIYLHPVSWYLSIEQKRDVIEMPIDHKLDIVGWDLKKALLLLKKSNPPLLEWLQSSIVYTEHSSVVNDLRVLAQKTFSEKSCLFHYLNMAKRNAKRGFDEKIIKVKQLLNVVKPLLACKWIEKNHSMSPNEIQVLLDGTVKDSRLYSEIEKLVSDKQNRIQQVGIHHVDGLLQYIFEEIERLSEYVKTVENRKDLYDQIDTYFLSVLKQIWGNKW
ncbi:nucleotidyltransferase domain-containing protein [Alkalihalobacillus sp. BA299]|uniref:nucleotidyltransferase domain-containing protein n=1 Tax=Alkalihalobacillus sp. BA299 TaxID=2815938 RepID=UPI001ADCF9B1|nr:nucleotidyltransferase domain-containing protein [Alkalihalobacillus sp. BA299]